MNELSDDTSPAPSLGSRLIQLVGNGFVDTGAADVSVVLFELLTDWTQVNELPDDTSHAPPLGSRLIQHVGNGFVNTGTADVSVLRLRNARVDFVRQPVRKKLVHDCRWSVHLFGLVGGVVDTQWAK